MNTREYIESGVLELYIFGKLSEPENEEVQVYANEYPEIQQEIESIEKAIINLSPQCPDGFMTAGRILEIIDANDETKALGRKRFRHYQQAGLEVVTHTI